MNPKKYDAILLKSMTIKLNDELKTMIDDGFEVWQLDESCFNGQERMRYAWSRQTRNVEVPDVSHHHRRSCVLAAVNQSGRVTYTIKPRQYFNAEDVKQFLVKLKRFSRKKNIAVFWDNASCHVSKATRSFISH